MSTAQESPTGFIAYASGNPALVETLDAAARQITDSGVARLQTWQSLQIGGRLLMSSICDAIAQSPLFIAEVSVLNPNVLFELGFAIASRKRIWLLLDGTRARTRSEFDRFQLLTTVGYREFNNSNDILRLFFSDQPYASLDKTIYGDIFNVATRHAPSKILYLKSEIETDASIKMSRKMARAHFSVLVDDPAEMRTQSLAWYARSASSALGVAAHLLDQDAKNALFHNAKLALICGMALGFGKPLLMLAHEPYSSPLGTC